MERKRVAVIGYGALGKILAEGIRSTLKDLYLVSGIWDVQMDTVRPAIETAGFRPYESFDMLLADQPDFAVEIASGQAVREYGDAVLNHRIPFIITSIGALADDELYCRLQAAAQENHTKIYLPSGAIGGLDVLQTLTAMGNAVGRIENRKAPESLNGAPYLKGRMLSEEHPEEIFRGTAREAIAGFPKNVNVAVASALASVGVDQMEVVIESFPGLTDNIHKVTIENDLAKAVIEISSSPDPVNPKSSTMTAWSIVALLKNLASPIEIR